MTLAPAKSRDWWLGYLWGLLTMAILWIMLVACCAGRAQASIGLKFDCPAGQPADRAAFIRAYDRAMRELPPPLVPALTTAHCRTPGMDMNSTRVTTGAASADIYLADADLWQFSNGLSLVVHLRRLGKKTQTLAQRVKRAGEEKPRADRKSAGPVPKLPVSAPGETLTWNRKAGYGANSERPRHTKLSADLCVFYEHANHAWFDGKLPEGLPVYWARQLRVEKTRSLEAVAFDEKHIPFAIFVDRRLDDDCFDCARLLVLHGMAHISAGGPDTNPAFQAEMRRLAAAGAMDGIW